MNRKFLFFIVGAMTCAAVCGANFLNGGFEKEETRLKSGTCILRLAEHWQTILQSGMADVGAELTSDAKSGSKAMKMFTKVPKAFVGTYQIIDCKPDSDIIASAWMKSGQSSCTAYFRIYFIDKDGKQDKKYLMPGWNLSTKWNHYKTKFHVPSYAVKIKFGIETLSNLASNVELYVDDIELEETAGPVLNNGILRAEINPFFGGCINSLEWTEKGEKIQFTIPRTMNNVGGLALEVIPEPTAPGTFANHRYSLKVIEPDRKIMTERTEETGANAGLCVRKTFSLAPDTTKIDVSLEFVNTGKKELFTSCRVQNVLAAKDGFFTSPTRDWLQVFHKTPESLKTTREIRSNNLQSGWLAKTNPDSTIIFAFPLSHIRNGYSWVNSDIDTVEWFYAPIRLAPGKTWKTTYSINLAVSPNPVFAFDGKTAFGVDSLEVNATKNLTISAVVPISSDVKLNSSIFKCDLKAGEVRHEKLSIPAVDITCGDFNAVYGAKNNYKSEFIRGVNLPPPKKISKASTFDGFFPFMFEDVALTWEESTGVNGAVQQFIRHAENTMRECAASHFNFYMMGRITQPHILPKTDMPGGKNLFGELAVKYDYGLASNTLIIGKSDIEVEKYRPRLLKMMDFFYCDSHIKLIRQYRSRYKAFFTADEITGQNIPCMIEAHEELAQRVADIPAYPYLNIHTRAYIPYVPVFFGDWYPINRKEFGGRDPWSVGRIVAETVALAKDVPVHAILQSFGYFKKHYGFPFPAEIRMMAHLAAANGAKGIMFHEINNRGLSWRYNYGYHYTARGNAGGLTPIWFTLGECARELTTVGPQLVSASPCPVPDWLKLDSPRYRSDNGYYDGPQVKFYTLARKDGPLFAVAVNHSEKTAASLPVTFTPPNRESVYSLTKMIPVKGKYRMELKPGGAEYFVIGKESEVKAAANEVALERFKRAEVAFRIAADRAAGNGVDLTPAFQLEKEAVAAAAKKNGQEALKKIDEAETVMNHLIAASGYGKFNAEWNKVRTALSDVSFLFLTHFDLVIPPHLRAKTARYAKWDNTDDPEMQKRVDDVAECWTEYWRIENQIVHGKLSSVRDQADSLMKKAFDASKTATAYLKANEQKIVVDDPYAE